MHDFTVWTCYGGYLEARFSLKKIGETYQVTVDYLKWPDYGVNKDMRQAYELTTKAECEFEAYKTLFRHIQSFVEQEKKDIISWRYVLSQAMSRILSEYLFVKDPI